MTTIRQVLQPYYAEGMAFTTPEAKHKFELMFNGGRLNADMNSLALNHAGWEYFNYLWRLYDGRDYRDIYSPVHPDTLIETAANLGFIDVEPLMEWVESLKIPMTGKVQKLASGSSTNFTIPYDSFQDVSFSDCIQILRDSGATLTSDAVIHAQDDVYKLLDKPSVGIIRSYTPVKKMVYRANRSDCDKFATMFKSYLGYQGYGNVTVGYVEMTLWTADNVCTGAHAVNVILYKDESGNPVAKFLEPQSLNMYNMNEMWLGAGINGTPVRSEIYWVVF